MLRDWRYLLLHTISVTFVTARIVASYLWVLFIERLLDLRVDPERLSALHARNAALYLRTAQRLKGGMIKVGQFISTRVDVMPIEWVRGLAMLQDRVDPEPYTTIRTRLAEELGRPPEQVFASIEERAVAAASFGQVHRGRLPDGTEVAIKVQHRDIARTLEVDLAIFRGAVAVLGKAVGVTVDISRVYAEIAHALREELRYDREAEHATLARQLLGDDKTVVIPRIYTQYCTSRLIVMDFIRGEKVTDVDAMRRLGVSPGEVIRIVIKTYVKQIYVDGFFQSDPHPGNLFFIPPSDDVPFVRIGIVDFGQSKRIPSEVHEALRQAVFCVIFRNLEGFMQALIRLGLIGPEHIYAAHQLIDVFSDQIKVGAPSEFNSLDFVASGRAIANFLRQVEGLQIPNDLVLYGRTLGLLHGLATSLDKDVSIFELAAPYFLGAGTGTRGAA